MPHSVSVAAMLAIPAPRPRRVQPFRPTSATGDHAAIFTIHVRVGGKGPAVVLLHGYGETGDMGAPGRGSARDHTVIVPDSVTACRPARGGYDWKTQAQMSPPFSTRSRWSRRPGHARHRQHGGLRSRFDT
jgi:hypothetical protein